MEQPTAKGAGLPHTRTLIFSPFATPSRPSRVLIERIERNDLKYWKEGVKGKEGVDVLRECRMSEG